MSTNTAVTRIGGQVLTLETLLKKSQAEIAKALPMQMSVDRLARVAISSVRKSPDLQKCDALSIVACVIQGAQLGLEMDGVLGNAYMVPYSNQAQFIIGYKGLVTLAYRSDRISRIDGKNVYEGDEFDYQYGTDPFITHVPKGEHDSDKITHTYVIIKLADGNDIFEVWTAERIKAHRDRFSQGFDKKPSTSPWTFAPEAMFLKTVARAAFKFAPISVGLQGAIAMDEQYEAGIPQALTSDLAESLTEPTNANTGQVLNRDEVMKGGKHKGVAWRNLPDDYVQWMAEKARDKETRSFAEQEITAREYDQSSQGADSEATGADGEADLISDMAARLTLLLSDTYLFNDEERVMFGPEAEGGNHDEAWLVKQIIFVEKTKVKREVEANAQTVE